MNTFMETAVHARRTLLDVLASAPLLTLAMHSPAAYGESGIEELQQQIQSQSNRLQEFERQLYNRDVEPGHAPRTSDNAFNPAISVILDGRYASYDNAPRDYTLSGFGLGGEAAPAPAGFSLGHSELVMSNNIDDRFFGRFTLAFAEHDGETEVELEEAWFETLLPGGGWTARAGRFYSGVGYLNQQHEHAWDFSDAPLVYRGLFGNQYFDDGVRMSWIAPTYVFLELGAEAFAGSQFPAGGEHDQAGVWTAYANLGGDVGVSHSWLAGISYLDADRIERSYGGHAHAGGAEIPLFEGDSRVIGLNAVYKWAPHGNYRERNVKLQFEYFNRDDSGDLTLLESAPLETGTLDSRQQGWYLQAVWQLARHWRTALRYDSLDSDNRGSDPDVLDETGLLDHGHSPTRSSIMAEWNPSEYSRIRLQYNRDHSGTDPDNQVFLQYTFNMGSHGAHAF